MAATKVTTPVIKDGAVTSAKLDTNIAIDGNLTVDTNTLYVDSTNNRVGIGTTSPSSILDIQSNTSLAIRIGSSAGVNGYQLKSNVSSVSDFGFIIEDYSGVDLYKLQAGSSGSHHFYIDGSEKMRITSTGNVGIGTTSPSSTLEIAKNDQTNGATLSITNSFDGTNWTVNDIIGTIDFKITDGSTPQKVRGQIKVFDDATLSGTFPAYNAMSFSTANLGILTERMRIDSSGNLHLGNYTTQSANGLLDLTFVNTNNTEHSGINFQTDASTGRCYINYERGVVSSQGSLIFGTSNSERMRITSGGSLLVGTQTSAGTGGITAIPNATAGSGAIYFNRTGTISNSYPLDFRNGGTTVGFISYNNTSTTYSTSSDYRLKENVVPMEGALDRVDALKPSRFNFIADADKTVDGFLAHEVADVVPEAISGEKNAVDEDGNAIYQGIDQSKLVPLLVGAIQELKAEIETLKSQINN